jgi:hypothetical protein
MTSSEPVMNAAASEARYRAAAAISAGERGERGSRTGGRSQVPALGQVLDQRRGVIEHAHSAK